MMKIKNKKDVKKFTLQFLIVALAGVFGGITFKTFFESQNIIPTGFSGLALIIHNLFLSISVSIPTSIIYLLINVVIFTIALKVFGWKFLILSLVGTATYTICMQFGNFSFILENSEQDKLLFSIVGAMLSGISIGLAFRFGGSTGGSEICGNLINKLFPKIKTGYCLMFINLLVLVLSAITSGLSTFLYALLITVINALTTNLVLDGSKRIVAIYIVTNKEEEISKSILNKFHRGVTKIDAEGEFSKSKKSLLLTLVPNNQLSHMKKIIYEIDKDAFMYSSIAIETIGESEIAKKMSYFKTKIKNSRINLKSCLKYKKIKYKNRKKLLKYLSKLKNQ